MDRIVYKNPGGPDVICEIDRTESGECKYSLSCKVWIGVNQAAIYRTAGEAKDYESAVALCETFSKRLYALATAGENHAER